MKMTLQETKIIETEVELKPCPFCGSDNLDLIHSNGEWGYRSSTDYVKCLACGIIGPLIEDSDCGRHRDKAIREWNTRKPMDSYVEQLRWERDVAISQLEKLGVGFGEKIEDEMIKKVKEGGIDD